MAGNSPSLNDNLGSGVGGSAAPERADGKPAPAAKPHTSH